MGIFDFLKTSKNNNSLFDQELQKVIDEFELTKNTLISGEVNLNSDFNLDHVNGSLLLINSLIDSVQISSISGQFGYNNGIIDNNLLKELIYVIIVQGYLVCMETILYKIYFKQV